MYFKRFYRGKKHEKRHLTIKPCLFIGLLIFCVVFLYISVIKIQVSIYL